MKTRIVCMFLILFLAFMLADSVQAELGVGLWSEDVDGG